MTNKQLKKYLLSEFPNLKKPLFSGDPIRLFDTVYHIPSFEWVDNAMTKAVESLTEKGLSYQNNKSDCDNWALWIQALVTMQWALESEINEAITVGFDTDKGHALNIAVTTEGVRFWNYGVYVPDWNGKILEIEFK